MLVKCSLAADCGNDRCDHVVKHEPEIYRGVLCNVGAVRCPYRRKQVQCQPVPETEKPKATKVIETYPTIRFTCQKCEGENEFFMSDVFKMLAYTVKARIKAEGMYLYIVSGRLIYAEGRCLGHEILEEVENAENKNRVVRLHD